MGIFGLRLLVVATMMILGSSGVLFAADPNAQADDGWRRTANGWEHVGELRAEALAVGGHHYHFAQYKPADPASRVDSHPAALAFLQVLAVALAFAYFPANCRSRKPMIPTA